MARYYEKNGHPALQRRYQGTRGIGTFRIFFMLGLLMTGGVYAGRELQDRMIGGLQEWSGLHPVTQLASQPVVVILAGIEF